MRARVCPEIGLANHVIVCVQRTVAQAPLLLSAEIDDCLREALFVRAIRQLGESDVERAFDPLAWLHRAKAIAIQGQVVLVGQLPIRDAFHQRQRIAVGGFHGFCPRDSAAQDQSNENCAGRTSKPH